MWSRFLFYVAEATILIVVQIHDEWTYQGW